MCFIGYFTEVTINYCFLFYSFAADFLKHFVKWNLNYDFKYIKIFSKLNSHNMADTFREELMIEFFFTSEHSPARTLVWEKYWAKVKHC